MDMMSALGNFIAVISFIALVIASLAYPMLHQFHVEQH